jgi:hypothetical protein
MLGIVIVSIIDYRSVTRVLMNLQLSYTLMWAHAMRLGAWRFGVGVEEKMSRRLLMTTLYLGVNLNFVPLHSTNVTTCDDS